MVQPGRSLSFALKTGEGLRNRAGNFLRQELEADEAMQPCVLSLIDHTHRAANKFFDNGVVGDGSPIIEFGMLGGN